MSKQKPFKPAKTGSGVFGNIFNIEEMHEISDEDNKIFRELREEKHKPFKPVRGLRATSGIIDDAFINQREIEDFKEAIIHLYGSMENYVKSLEENLNDWPVKAMNEKDFSREYDSVWIDTDATPEEREEEKRRRNR